MQAPMLVKLGSDLPVAAVLALYDAVGWTAYTAAPDALMTALRQSTYVATLWDGQTLVGLARVISDDVTLAWLQDLLVDPRYQRRGLGRRLMNLCLDRFQHCRQFQLLTDARPETAGFYQSVGLEDVAAAGLRAYRRTSGAS